MSTQQEQYTLGYWLLVLVFMVFAMVVIGGLTRLTGSGLSIVDWDPIMGILPPFSENSWHEVFARYQQFPEYQKVNFGMTLQEFKSIFWLEYIHRLIGRTLVLVLLVPTIYCLRRPSLRHYRLGLVCVWLLGALQGVMGWYMVKSGLVNNPWVSQYRLTAHLLLAVLIMGSLLWMVFGLLGSGPENFRSRKYGYLVLGLVILTIVMGGFTAGLHAGLVYNTFPDMGGRWVPDDWLAMNPLWRNIFENPTTVQFLHRLMAFGTLMATGWLWIKRPGPLVYALSAAVLVQLVLGVATLLTHVNTTLAVAHQAWAMVVFAVAVWLSHNLACFSLRK